MMTMFKAEGLIDTSVLVAFFNKEDKFFDKAKGVFEKVEGKLILIDAVVNESLALLRKRVSKKLAVEVAKRFLDEDLFEIRLCGKKVYRQAMKKFISAGGKYSFTDCVLALEAEETRMKLFAFDKHFRDFKVNLVS